MQNFKIMTFSTLLLLGLLSSCHNASDSNNSEGNSSTIAPSDGDKTRYNLSEQQEMTLQGDTLKIDSTKSDSIQ